MAYKYSDETINYINDLEEYVATLKVKNQEINQEQNIEEIGIEEEKNKDDEQLALLFGIQKDLKFI